MFLSDTFDDFIHNVVSLDDTRLNRTQRAHNAVRSDVEALDAVQDLSTGPTFLQGSYAIYTPVRPCDNESSYDVDIVLPADFRNEHDRLPSGFSVVHWLKNQIEENDQYSGKTEVKGRCVRINYEADEGRFHLDFVPAHTLDPAEGPVQVPPDWSSSHPKGYREWFERQAAQLEKKRHLRYIVRMLKYWRNLQGTGPNSMILTTLSAQAASEADNYRSIDQALVSTMEGICEALNDEDLSDIEVPNPSLPEKNFARDWSVAEMLRFKRTLSEATETAKEALKKPKAWETAELWNSPVLFDGEFPIPDEDLSEDAREVGAAMASGGLYFGSNGPVSTNPESNSSTDTVPDNDGFYGAETE
jgi:hypothetical protein